MHRYQEPDFEEDRIVVRDNEPKKKGWFSRKSKSSKLPQKVSRPPGASNFIKKPPKSREGTLDDELPPRLDDGAPPPASEKSSVAESVDAEQTDLPVHAGFDFNAIKAVIGEAGINEGEVRVPQIAPLPVPPVPPPSQQSESESVPRPLHRTPSTPSLPSPDLPPASQGGVSESRHDLTSHFTRSMPLNSLHDSGEPGKGDSRLLRPEKSPITHRTSDPTLLPPSVNSDAAAAWPPNDTSGAFAHQTQALSFGDTAPASMAYGSSTKDLYSDFITPSGLSFGDVDGLVTLPSITDPWNARTAVGDEKIVSSFNANPWS